MIWWGPFGSCVFTILQFIFNFVESSSKIQFDFEIFKFSECRRNFQVAPVPIQSPCDVGAKVLRLAFGKVKLLSKILSLHREKSAIYGGNG